MDDTSPAAHTSSAEPTASGEAPEAALAQAKSLLAAQEREIAQLRRHIAADAYAREMRQALELAALVGTLALPVSHARLLEMIVETSTHVIEAGASALFLLDEERQELFCEVVVGGGGESLKNFRLPVGRGVVGYVAATRQPLAIAQAKPHADGTPANGPQPDETITQSLGYTPQSLLCVPLFHGDRLVGVLELCDKMGADAFSLEDMQTLGMFGNLAAVAVEMSRTQRHLAPLLLQVLDSSTGLSEAQKQTFRHGAQELGRHLEQDEGYSRSLELALLVREISAAGELEWQTCHSLLSGFADYLRQRASLHRLWNMPSGEAHER